MKLFFIFTVIKVKKEQALKRVNKNGDGARTQSYAIKSTFEKSLKEFEKTKTKFEVGDLVLARMTGYAPWPAKIVSFTKDGRRATCFFFGSQNQGPVGVRQMIPFKDGFDVIRLVKMQCLTDFEKGVREIEIEHHIPEDMSSLER